MAKKGSKKQCRMAVTSLGDSLGSKIGSLARCNYFVVFEGTPKKYEIVRCEVRGAADEKGPSVARALTKLDVGIVVTSTIGPRAFSILKDAGVSVKAGCKGTVGDAAIKCAAGKLRECEGATYAGNIHL